MTNQFLDRLLAGDILVADGATGTNLQKAGLKAGTPPEDWLYEQPDKVLDLHRAFVEAGADIILTDTFGGTRLRMKDSPYAPRVTELNKLAVGLARQAAQARPGVLVAGSMGPTGLLFAPMGPLTQEQAVAAYAEQAEALAVGGVDLLVIETHFDLNEASAALEGARKGSDLPVVMSFSYDRGVRTMMGLKPTQAAQALSDRALAAIGANCGTTLENMEKIIQEYAALGTGLPIWAKPNAGMPVMREGATVYEITPEQMAGFALRYIDAGARIVGGCCGSTPEHIAAIARAVRTR